MSVGVEITRNRFKELAASVKGSLGREVRNVTLDILGQAVNRAPVEEGILRGSGTAHFGGERIASGSDVAPDAVSGQGQTGGADSTNMVGVVAFNAEYAEAQHERTDYVHPKGGEAKYLENPVEENRVLYNRRLADAVKRGVDNLK